jgi:N-acetylmuramoyl-L-alanine amidase
LSGQAQAEEATTGAMATASPQEIRVVYPTTDKIDASSSFIVGCCQPGASLTCNGDAVRLSKQGFFAHVVQLKPGDNKFLLVESGPASATREVHAYRTVEPPPIPPGQLTIMKETLQPSQETAVMTGDLIHFKVRATPGAQVTVSIANRSITLRTLDGPAQQSHAKNRARAAQARSGSKIALNGGLAVAYGKPFQRSSPGHNDTYFGFYKVTESDDWQNLHATVSAHLDGKSISLPSTATFSTLKNPMLAQTNHDDTIVRVGANAGRTTPLAKEVRLLVDGWQGDQVRCVYAPNKHFWIARQDLTWENGQAAATSDKRQSGSPGPAPIADARAINITDDEFGSYISIPLTQRLPYQIVQSIKPNTLVLKLYGVTSDTDWISDPHLNASTDEDAAIKAGNHAPIDAVTWNQVTDGQYDVAVTLKGRRQWGFKAEYVGSELRLHIRRAPRINRSNQATPLAGLKICVDPGHGGKERGAIGPSNVPEKSINLGIGLKLRGLLEAAGAHVIMTRADDRDVSLDERVRIANENNVDILLSVHNNSLPDGRDPWKERGTSSYWYHPQSTELARTLKTALVSALGLPELGNRFQNLALCRPSCMPAVLAEVGFVINPEEYALLISPEGQMTAAEGLLKGLEDYLKSAPGAEARSDERKP